ncbi:MAG: F0F1 ATP synthase subunit A [Flavobacteriales bacterium]|nr:F0F1 ATP synthase subunit A [Flavobacteriales bacterium]
MLKNNIIKSVLFALVALVYTNSLNAETSHKADVNHEENHEATSKDEKYDPIPVIMHHIADAHDWHLFDYNGHSYSMPLPIILWTDNGLVTFMSSAFHHDDAGHHLVEKNGMSFVKVHGKIYQLEAGAIEASFDEAHHITNGVRPIDLSITKNVFSMLMSVLIILFIFIKTASHYTKNGAVAPKGIASWMEPLILFVRDDIAKVNIGEKKYAKFMPYLLTIFFFIWFNNLLGLIPWIGGANLTGNIAVTLVLAVFTLLVTNLNGNKAYWGHIFWMPGAPIPVKIMLMPIELVGVLTKPFALMVRLFANITAGHIIVLSLISLIFIFKNAGMGAVSVPFALFISVLELLVAFLQAYVFTMLSALFIGTAVADHH